MLEFNFLYSLRLIPIAFGPQYIYLAQGIKANYNILETVRVMEYQPTTIIYDPYFEQDALQLALSKSALDYKPFESLTYSLSIQKLSKTLKVSPKKEYLPDQNYCRLNSKTIQQRKSPNLRIKLDKILINQSNRILFKKKKPATCQMIKRAISAKQYKHTENIKKFKENEENHSLRKFELNRKFSLKQNKKSTQEIRQRKKRQNDIGQCSTISTIKQNKVRTHYFRENKLQRSQGKIKSERSTKIWPSLNCLSKKSKETFYIEQTAKKYNYQLK